MQEPEQHSPPEAGAEGEHELRRLAEPACEECVRNRRRMKYLQMLVLFSCFIIIVESVLALKTFNSSERLVRSIQEMVEAQRAQSFASGFIYGQRSTIRHTGLPVALSPVHDFSKEDRTNASKYGFTQADDDPEQ